MVTGHWELGTLSHRGGKSFAHKGKPGTCLWCGDKLHPENEGGIGGYRDNGHFCSLRCGYQWAVRSLTHRRPG